MKVICEECNWRGQQDQLLTAINPFDSDDDINGCPQCKSINTALFACEETDCWEPVTCGFPTAVGYRQTCGRHVPGPAAPTPSPGWTSDEPRVAPTPSPGWTSDDTVWGKDGRLSPQGDE